MTSRGDAAGPGLAWFHGLETDAGLRERMTLRVDPPAGLKQDTPVIACERLRDAWKRTYIPCDAHLAELRKLVDRAKLNFERRIPSACAYETAIYSRAPIVPEEQEIWGITGLAGVGKSSAMKAVRRAIQPPARDGIGSAVLAPLEPVVHLTIRAERSSGPLLQSLANPVFVGGRRNIRLPELAQHLREWFYVKGTQLLLADELQSMTRDKQATTLIANLICDLNELGPAVVYIFNFSLGHKLRLRQQEDKDRLLAHCLTLEPPAPDDMHWKAAVAEYVRQASGLIELDHERDSAELHRLTGGLYRLLSLLLLEACRNTWSGKVSRPVTMDAVRAAFQAAAYSSQREDVEALAAIGFSAGLRARRSDLVSPFPGSPVVRNGARPPRQEPSMPPPLAAVRLMESALRVDERRVVAQLRAVADPSEQEEAKASATVTKLVRRPALSVDALLAGARALSAGSERRAKSTAAGDEEKD